MKILIAFPTYPRDGIVTPSLLKKTFDSLIADQDLTSHTIKILVVGDDYPNMDELKPIFNNYDCEFYNINVNDALRNRKDVPKDKKWCQAAQRSTIFIYEKALLSGFDYLLISGDDELFLNKKLLTSIEYIKKYNNPDIVFSLGIHNDLRILPPSVSCIPEETIPTHSNIISSGVMYNLNNTTLMNTMIAYRKLRWQHVVQNLVDLINPEDAEQWFDLNSYLKNKTFTTIMIPTILINHYTERTLYNYLK